jgi:hypothetical protein
VYAQVEFAFHPEKCVLVDVDVGSARRAKLAVVYFALAVRHLDCFVEDYLSQ